MIIVIDNYDSFTFNLVQLLRAHREDVRVVRNDRMSVEELGDLNPHGIVISPGPGRPEDAGISIELIQVLGERIPILGVCLGHQAIAMAYGGSVVRAARIMHGKTSTIFHAGITPFDSIPNPFEAARYHSLIVAPGDLPADLEVTAHTDEGTIMAIRHRTFPVTGIQFHPESILTRNGPRMLTNWLQTTGG